MSSSSDFNPSTSVSIDVSGAVSDFNGPSDSDDDADVYEELEALLADSDNECTDSCEGSDDEEAELAPVPRQQIRLPPSSDSNFVVHYRRTDFHVHSLVLVTHSTFFRNYLSSQKTLNVSQAWEVLDKGQKRRKVVGFASLAECRKCGPLSLTHCIELPEEFGLSPATEDELHRFFLHLYFASTLHLPPLTPKAEILAAISDDTPLCPTFPSTPVSFDEPSSYVLMSGVYVYWSEALLSLFHHFDCRAALSRCDAVIACRVRVRSEVGVNCAWQWLSVASRYGLKETEAACIAQVRTDGNVRLRNPLYEWRLAHLSPSTLRRVIEALSTHIHSFQPIGTQPGTKS